MGADTSQPKLFIDVDSPDGTGLKSVVSEPFDKFLTPAQFWRGLKRFHKQGAEMPLVARWFGIHRDMKVKHLPNGAWETALTIETPLGYTYHEVALHEFDWPRNMHISTVYTDEDRTEWKYTRFVRIWSDPYRLEAWMDIGEQRISDQRLVEMLKSTLTDVFAQEQLPIDRVTFRPDVPSPASASGDKSVFTGPLDDVVSPEDFWRLYEARVRSGPSSSDAATVESYEVRDMEGGKPLKLMSIATVEDQRLCYSVHAWDGKAEEWTSIDYGTDATLTQELTKFVVKAHRNPFRLEAYMRMRGGRRSGKVLKGFIEYMISKVGALAEAPEETTVDRESSEEFADAEEPGFFHLQAYRNAQDRPGTPPNEWADPEAEAPEETPESLGAVPGQEVLLRLKSGGAVAVRCCTSSPSVRGSPCVLTDALDRHLAFEDCQGALEAWRQQAWYGDPGKPFEHSVASEYESTIKLKLGAAIAAQAASLGTQVSAGDPVSTKYLLNPKRDMLYMATSKEGGDLIFQHFVVIHKSPLRIEAWVLDDKGGRQGNSFALLLAQSIVTLLLMRQGLLPDE